MLPVGQLQANCFLVFDGESRETLIIDPGDDADYISDTVSRHQLIPKQIIATHGHFDHIMAAAEISLMYQIPFFIHQKDEFLVKRLPQSVKHFLNIDSSVLTPKISGYIKQGSLITVADRTLSVLETPGHTPGSVSLYYQQEDLALVGDLLFADGSVGRSDFAYGDEQKLEASVKKIFSLPPHTSLFCGHGRQTTVRDAQYYRTLA